MRRFGFLSFLSLFVFSFAFPANSAVVASGYDFGDHTSATLVNKGWAALAEKDYNAVSAYTKKCIDLYSSKAQEQQSSLEDYPTNKDDIFSLWALNDVGTAYFIQGKAYKEQNRAKDAKQAFKTIVEKFGYSQCWDESNQAHWKVAEGARDELNLIESAYDFGDYTSQTLTARAWEALSKKEYEGVEVYTKKCFQLYEEEAQKMQESLSDYPPKDRTFNYWALNDVGTCYFVLGEALAAQNKFQEALEVYKVVMEDFSYSQCWDTKGWFWKPAVASRGKINKIKAEQGL